MIRTLTLLLTLAGSIAATAAPEPFARGRFIEPAGDTVVQRLLVPADVYAWTVRDDLGDLRVVNGAADVVPHALARPPAEAAYTEWRPLPLFPLPAADPDTADRTRVDIELGDDGTVVAVRGGGPADRTGGAVLLDASAIGGPLSELSLRWPDHQADFVARWRVEASANLDTWQVLVASATVAELTTDGERISARRIEVPETDARYLRLTRLDAGVLELSGIDARGRLPSRPQRDWLTLTGRANDGYYEFDSGGRYPIDRIAVEVDRDTFLGKARLWSRASAAEPWRDRGGQVFYRVALDQSDSGRLSAEPMAVGSDRYWRLQWSDDSAAPPSLRVGWLPHELWFLRQGPGPFQLLYGRADTDAQPWPVRDLAQRLGAGTDLGALPVAALGDPQTLGGRASLEAAPQPVDWRTVLLWSVLLVGVALVAWLALRVLR